MTPKERAFVVSYLGPANGNATQAAIDAGYSAKGAHVRGSLLLSKVKVREAIEAIQVKRETKAIATAERRDELLTTFAEDAKLEARDRIKAISEMNKCSGRHSSTVNITGRLTLEDALAGSRG